LSITYVIFIFSSRRRHTRFSRDWSSDVCSSDLVADLERSLAFYRDILGFTVTMRYGDSAVFLSAGGYHHHIGLNTWAGQGVAPQIGRASCSERVLMT